MSEDNTESVTLDCPKKDTKFLEYLRNSRAITLGVKDIAPNINTPRGDAGKFL